jgi:hypothetical protein
VTLLPCQVCTLNTATLSFTKCDISHVVSCECVCALQFCGWLCMCEQNLRCRLTATPPFLEFLHENLPDNDVIIIHKDGREDDGYTVLGG